MLRLQMHRIGLTLKHWMKHAKVSNYALIINIQTRRFLITNSLIQSGTNNSFTPSILMTTLTAPQYDHTKMSSGGYGTGAKAKPAALPMDMMKGVYRMPVSTSAPANHLAQSPSSAASKWFKPIICLLAVCILVLSTRLSVRSQLTLPAVHQHRTHNSPVSAAADSYHQLNISRLVFTGLLRYAEPHSHIEGHHSNNYETSTTVQSMVHRSCRPGEVLSDCQCDAQSPLVSVKSVGLDVEHKVCSCVFTSDWSLLFKWSLSLTCSSERP